MLLVSLAPVWCAGFSCLLFACFRLFLWCFRPRFVYMCGRVGCGCGWFLGGVGWWLGALGCVVCLFSPCHY